MRQPVLVTLTVLITWYFSFLIILIIPLDVSNTIYSNTNCTNISEDDNDISTTTITTSETPKTTTNGGFVSGVHAQFSEPNAGCNGEGLVDDSLFEDLAGSCTTESSEDWTRGLKTLLEQLLSFSLAL